MAGRSNILFEEDLVKIEEMILKHPLGSHEIAQIAELSGRLKDFGIEVIPRLEMMLKKWEKME